MSEPPAPPVANRTGDWATVELDLPLGCTPVPPRATEQLLVLVGPEPGQAFDITDRLVIGRDPSCDVTLQDASVSRRHAEITRGPTGEISVSDLSSRNGVFVNGAPTERLALNLGDRIQLGSRVILLLTMHDPLQAVLVERQKMEAIGRITAGIAHDFKNIVFAAHTTCVQLTERLQELGISDREVSECQEDLMLALDRAADLTRSIGTLGRAKATTAAARVELGLVCEEVARLCERTFDPKIQIKRRWTGGLFVRAHRSELHQILLNLCLNARDAMPAGGMLRIAGERGPGMRARDGSSHEAIVLRVADTGAGMTNEVRARVFEPFFTTKGEGHGTGLGLATVHDLVTAMGGRVDVESSVGRGSVFLVWLPAA